MLTPPLPLTLALTPTLTLTLALILTPTLTKVLIKYMDGDWKWHKLWQEAIRGVKLKQPKLPKPEAAPPQREERGGTFRSLGAAWP